jgi:hypothetical protein
MVMMNQMLMKMIKISKGESVASPLKDQTKSYPGSTLSKNSGGRAPSKNSGGQADPGYIVYRNR